jgi:alpha-beta hydrolase superfamily lysophospholipase
VTPGELFLRSWPVPAGVTARGAVVLVHGLGEHSGRYEHVGRHLAALGYAVQSYDHRGHGDSPGARGGLPGPDALLDDLRTVFDRAAAAAPDGAPPFLLGHSLGGTVAARAATGGWVAPRGLVLSSPALRVTLSRAQRALLRAGLRLAPDRAVPNRLPSDKLSHDPAVGAAYRADPLVHDRISPRLTRFLLEAGAAARRDAARFTVPTLVLVAGRDHLVDASGARDFAAALPRGVGTLRVYDELYHELFNEREPERARVLDDLARWLAAH